MEMQKEWKVKGSTGKGNEKWHDRKAGGVEREWMKIQYKEKQMERKTSRRKNTLTEKKREKINDEMKVIRKTQK